MPLKRSVECGSNRTGRDIGREEPTETLYYANRTAHQRVFVVMTFPDPTRGGQGNYVSRRFPERSLS